MSQAQEQKPLKKSDRDKLARMKKAFGKIDNLLFRLGLQGLQRMSRSSAIELKALEQTAHNAGLVTIERQLEILVTQVERYLDKDPLFTMNQYMTTLNRIWLLNNMARRCHEKNQTLEEMTEVIGEARRTYTELSETLVIQPLGATGWVSDTDFVGVTIYFYVKGKPDVIYQASNCKPCMYFGKDPKRLLNQTISDYVTFSISDMAHGAFSLEKAKVSRDGRLSLHKNLIVKKAPYLGAKAYESISVKSWIELADRLRTKEVHPALSTEPSLVFLAPAKLGNLTIDEKNAQAVGEIFDANGASLWVEVSLRAENNLLVDNLEFAFGKKKRLIPNAFFGRAWIAEKKIKFLPFTAIYHNPLQERAKGKKSKTPGRARNEVHLSLEALKYLE